MMPGARRADLEAEGARQAAAQPRAQDGARQAAADASAGRTPARAAGARHERDRGRERGVRGGAGRRPTSPPSSSSSTSRSRCCCSPPTRPSRRSIVERGRVRRRARGRRRRSRELHEARARFVDELEAGVDPEQALEKFIPAVMAVLPIARTVIGIIGRKRVVNFLAGFLARLISRYVPQRGGEAALAGDRRHRAADDLARGAGRERRRADAARVRDDRADGRGHRSARRRARRGDVRGTGAARGRGDRCVPRGRRGELPAAGASCPSCTRRRCAATWVRCRSARRRKYYKKYTRVFDVEITPQIAESLTTFGGTKLAAFLKDQLGVTAPVQARVHLYQAIAGTTLRADRAARAQRAGTRPGPRARRGPAPPADGPRRRALCSSSRSSAGTSPGAFRSSRRAIAVGQRFYYLEIAGARPRHDDDRHGRRSGRQPVQRGQRHARLPEGRVPRLRLPERGGRAEHRGEDPQARRHVGARARQADLRGRHPRRARRRHPAPRQDPHRGAAAGAVLRRRRSSSSPRASSSGWRRRSSDWVGKAVADYVKASAGEFVAATEDPADGVTIVVPIANPPGAPLVRKLLRGEGIGAGALGDLESLFKGQPRLSVKTVAGFRFD